MDAWTGALGEAEALLLLSAVLRFSSCIEAQMDTDKSLPVDLGARIYAAAVITVAVKYECGAVGSAAPGPRGTAFYEALRQTWAMPVFRTMGLNAATPISQ